MAKPVVFFVDKIRNPTTGREVNTDKIMDSTATAGVNLVENDLGIQRTNGTDVIYNFGQTPTAALSSMDTDQVMEITAPQEGQLLMYSNGKWVNSDITMEVTAD